MRRVVVTGVGVVSPVGIGADFWQGLLSGKVGIQRISLYDAGGFACQIAGEAPPFKVQDHVPRNYRKATKLMARDIELAVVAADHAFRDARLLSRAYTDSPQIDPRRFGCNIGAGLISADLHELGMAMHKARGRERPLDLKAWGREGMAELTPLWLLKYLPNMLACHVTIIHELMGPSNTITCADASSHLAIGEALRAIQRGAADLAICGGAECKHVPMGVLRQTMLNRLCVDCNDDPAGAVRPFDASASGTVLGEGAGLLILEELEHAQARGATIYAELAGFGASQDAHSLTDADPEGISQGAAITSALRDAGVSPAEVDLVIPHGLGLASHDRAELAGLRRALGAELSRVALAPLKAQTGNSAAGCGMDAAAAVLAVHHGMVPPAINTHKPIDGVKLNVAPEPRRATLRSAVSTVYSLGGQNAALVFRKVEL